MIKTATENMTQSNSESVMCVRSLSEMSGHCDFSS